MSDSDSDISPFAEKKSNTLVWIVPSVLLHGILLVVWLMMPDKPPREPSERKLTINRDQAERLQRHVEDANLVVLHANVSELQTIKKSMAAIREKKLAQLRDFETDRIRQAPVDAADVFTRFLDSQNLLVSTYPELLEAIRKAEALVPDAEKAKSGEGLGAVIPILPELRDLRTKAQSLAQTLDRETSQTFALLNTGETQLEWMSDPAVAGQLAELKTTMDRAGEIKDRIVKSVEGAYGADWAMTEMIDRADDYVESLKRYENYLEKGAADLEAKRVELTESIAALETEIEDIKTRINDARAELKAKEADKDQLNQLVKNLRETLDKQSKSLSNDKRELSRLKFVPEKWQVDKAKSIHRVSGNIFKPSPEVEAIPEAVQAQAQVARGVGELLKSIARNSEASGTGGAE